MLTAFNRQTRLKKPNSHEEEVVASTIPERSQSMDDAVLKESADQPQSAKKSKQKPNFWSKRYWTIEAIKMTALYIALSPMVAMPLYTHMIFYPDKTDYAKDIAYPLQQLKKDLGVNHEEVHFKTPDGKQLHGMFFAYPGATKVILVCHGNAGNIAHRIVLATALLECKANVFLFDYQGYGSSEGSPSLKGIVTDSVAAYDYLHQTRQIAPANIVVYGESLGTGAAAQLARQRQVAGIILQSGFSSLVSAGKDHLFFLRFYPDSWFPENLDNVAAMQKPHAPLLIIHGKDDPVLAYHNSEDLFAQASEPKKFISFPKFGHFVSRVDMKEYSQPVTAFINSSGGKSEK